MLGEPAQKAKKAKQAMLVELQKRWVVSSPGLAASSLESSQQPPPVSTSTAVPIKDLETRIGVLVQRKDASYQRNDFAVLPGLQSEIEALQQQLALQLEDKQCRAKQHAKPNAVGRLAAAQTPIDDARKRIKRRTLRVITAEGAGTSAHDKLVRMLWEAAASGTQVIVHHGVD